MEIVIGAGLESQNLANSGDLGRFQQLSSEQFQKAQDEP